MKAVAWIAAVVALLAIGWFVTVEGVVAIAFGWISFLRRVLPRMTVDWEGAVVGVTAFVLFTAGVHLLGRSARRSPLGESSQSGSWRFRWTVAIVLLVVISFAAGIAMIGVTHQIGWLAKSNQPLLGEAIAAVDDTRNNLKTISLGVSNYSDTPGRLPPGATLGEGDVPLHGWEVRVLPYIGAFAPVDFSKPWNDPVNQKYFKCVLPFFINAAYRTPQLTDEDGYGLDHFAGNRWYLPNGQGLKESEVTDGVSNTIMLGEVNVAFSPWGRPGNVRDPAEGLHGGPETFGGPEFRGGTYFSMGDAHVRFIADDVDPAVLRALSTPADGDDVGSESAGY